MEEEISLRELIEVILEGKWIIIAVSIVSVFFAGVLSFFVLSEKYEARANIMFDKKFVEQQGLSLESYKELVATHARFEAVYDELQLDSSNYTVNSLKKAVKTELNNDSNQIMITVSGENPEAIQKIANQLASNSVVDFRKRLIDDKERELLREERLLDSITVELEETPKLLGTTEIREGAHVIQIPQINPQFEKLATRWDEANHNVSQLQAEKEYLEQSLQTGGKGLYIMLHPAPLPVEAVAPRKMLNVAIAGVLGFMASVFLVFFRDFWRKTKPNQELGS
ncbi:YveK family protein [Desulfofalx alkaliphila]|uniref:YveK family protein n=1 Tax=Desulfofalx alkaliphila TaxID=105483 RepID=UPI0004E172C2|nr:Wzz/FepE/Etk N-terminal domain-containing protein [Desulfofalx alkaliphila]